MTSLKVHSITFNETLIIYIKVPFVDNTFHLQQLQLIVLQWYVLCYTRTFK